MNKLVTVLCCLALSACGTLSQPIWFESTDSLIVNHEYQRALEQAKNSETKDLELIRAIERQANIYRRKQLKRLQTHFIKKEWEHAEQLLYSLQLSQPPHPQFKRAVLQLEKLRSQEKLELESKVALAKAHLLEQQTQEHMFQRRNTQISRYWWQSQTPLVSEKHALADTLLFLSNEAIRQDNYKLAHTTFSQALEFNDELKDDPIRSQIRLGLKQRNAATISQRQTHLISKLRDAMEEENFEQILTISSVLSKPPFNSKAVDSALSDAQALLKENAQELEQQGDSIYRQGSIASAIELWQQAQALVPSLPGLQDKLIRAQKVKQKLDLLRQSQKQN